MAWTAGVTRTTGDLITAAQWNSYLGAAGSLDYLKTEADKHDDCSVSSPTRVLDTIYQNGSKTRLVAIQLQLGKDDGITAKIGSASPPTTTVGYYAFAGTTATVNQISMPTAFFVPANWYYEMEVFIGTPTINYSREYDLL